jgi:limonene-1,2-epoxide hydrolase
MSIECEEAVRAFLLALEAEHFDSAQADRVVCLMAPDARYHLYAWAEPFVGYEAIKEELLKQAPTYTNASFEFINVASVGSTVFVQRLDCMTINDKPAKFHIVGVFEVDDNGKIASWADYFDSAEITSKVGSIEGY